MKRVFLVVFVALTCVIGTTFSACGGKVVFPSSSISLGMSLTSEGKVVEEIGFSFQTEKLKALGVHQRFIDEVKNNMIGMAQVLRNEFYLSFLVRYSSSPNPDYKIGETLLVSDAFYSEESDMVGFVIEFKDFSAWQYFNGKDKQEDEEAKKKEIKYFTKSSSQGAFPFASLYTTASGEEITVGERYLRLYRNAYNVTLSNEVCEKLEKPSFVYDYSTPFANLKSNADITLQSGGLYHNIWIKDQDSFKDAQIILTSTSVNYGLWYLTLLVTVIFAFAVALVAVKLIKRKR